MTCRMGFLASLPLVLCGLFAATVPAASADLGPLPPEPLAEPAPAPSQWQFSFTPYGWAPSISGNVTARGHTVDFSDSFFQVVEKSDSLMALMGYFEARKGPLALFTDVVWEDLGFPGNLQVHRDPLAHLNVTLKAHAQLGYQQTIVQSGVAYEIAKWGDAASYTALDVLGSARYWDEQSNLDLNVTGTVDFQDLGLHRSGSLEVARSGDLEWVDPVVGGRLRHEIAPGEELDLEGDVGGFGVGSEFSWQVVGTYGFDTMCLGTPLHAVVGYRALAVDFSETGAHGRNGVDDVQYGPLLGASFRW